MQMNDSQLVPASREKVFAALNDPATLQKCIPGCQKLEVTAPNEMTATVVVKVGPVKASFATASRARARAASPASPKAARR
jgi:carbon monoxide dehydrogenase subunit G